MNNSMMMITAGLESENNKEKFNQTFRLIPTKIDCPYNEAIFDPEKQILFVISKQTQNNVAKIENGEKFYEYALITPTDIKLFIDMFAINKGFDYSQWVN